MMGDTPYGIVARRTGPSRVATLRGRATHAPANFRALFSDTGQHYIRLVWRPGAPKWVPGGERRGGWRGWRFHPRHDQFDHLVRGFWYWFLEERALEQPRDDRQVWYLAATFWAVRGWLPSGLVGSDKVRVDSKTNEDEQFIWESAAGVSFTVQNDTKMVHQGVKHGTKITCHLKKSSLSSWRKDA